jgi:hypothetical protein
MIPIGAFRYSARVVSLACCLALALVLGASYAQNAPEPYKPVFGQHGKDVIWIPTAQTLVDRMLDMAQATSADVLVDLGSGDGRTVITAAKRGVKALGIEYNVNMVGLSRQNAEKEGVGNVAQFVQADIFASDFSQATVVTMFLLPELNLQLRPKLLGMKPGTRIVSNSFDMGDWQADDYAEVANDCTSYCRAFLWIVPAAAAGTWQLPQGQLTLQQSYQMVMGTLTLNGTSTSIANGRVQGDMISFSAAGRNYSGKISGTTIAFTGDLPTGQPVGTATRSSR